MNDITKINKQKKRRVPRLSTGCSVPGGVGALKNALPSCAASHFRLII